MAKENLINTFTVYVGQIPAKSVTIEGKLDNPLYYKGDVITLRALLDPVNAYNKRILWRSSNTDVAVIREYNGYVQVTVVGAGTATISATWAGDSSIKDEYTIYTIIPVTGVKISNRPPNSRMTVGTKHKVTANVLPANATNTDVRWDSKNENVADIDEYGTITALAPGSSVITVTSVGDSRFTDTFTLTVVNPSVSGVTITNKNQNTITVDDVRTYTATVTPSNADNKAVKWISTKENVASINPNTGKLTALSAGTTVIKAVSVSNSAKYDEFTLTVKNPTEYDGHRIGKFITPENPYAIEAQEHSKAVYNTEQVLPKYELWYSEAMATAEGGLLFNMPLAAYFLENFLSNSGNALSVNIVDMVTENSQARQNTSIDLNNAIKAAEYFYSYYNSNITFTTKNEIIGYSLSYGNSILNATNNWYQAINSYRTWYSCNVTFENNKYTMIIDYHLRDFYNWDKTNTNPAPIVSQEQMYKLHCAGMAKDFKVTGYAKFRVIWSKGEDLMTGAEWTYY